MYYCKGKHFLLWKAGTQIVQIWCIEELWQMGSTSHNNQSEGGTLWLCISPTIQPDLCNATQSHWLGGSWGADRLPAPLSALCTGLAMHWSSAISQSLLLWRGSFVPFGGKKSHFHQLSPSHKVPFESWGMGVEETNGETGHDSSSASPLSVNSPSLSQMTVIGLLRIRLRELYLLLAAEGGVRDRLYFGPSIEEGDKGEHGE